MRKRKTLILLISALLFIPAAAQKKKAQVKKKKTTPVAKVETEENTKFEDMLEATQQVVFIDSVVVDKMKFLAAYQLTAEAGTITTFNKFFKTESQPYSTVYVNEMGNKCWFANNGRLFTADKLGNKWSEPTQLEGLGQYQRTNYPFVLSDGTTLYFAAITSEGLGGLDIYMSRYDSESGKYLLAENIGLPFNSDANDYMYAVDEFNNIAYFATDRRQPEGKVCIYAFIPNQKRVTYSSEYYDPEIIRSRARIDRIADTWGDGKARKEAIQRMTATQKSQRKTAERPQFAFAINDKLVYVSASQFRERSNKDSFTKLETMKKQLQQMGQELEKARRNYRQTGRKDEKSEVKAELIEYERKYFQLERNIRQLEKNIRNAEIRAL